MPNGGPHGNHFQEAQWGWGYSEGFEAGYREALRDVTGMRATPKRLAALLKRKFPEKEPPEIEDEASFLPSDVREWK